MPSLYNDVPSEWTDFYEIYDEAVRTAPAGASLVEVGSFWGKSAIYLAELAKGADKDLRVYAVDSWSQTPDNNLPLFDPARIEDHIEPRIHTQHHNSIFETFAYYLERSRLSPVPLRVMRMDSLEAAGLFAHSSLHFVFLDGDHDYEPLLKELESWSDLVAAGGMIAGHDWTEEFWGVEMAVTEHFGRDYGMRFSWQVEAPVCGRSWVARRL